MDASIQSCTGSIAAGFHASAEEFAERAPGDSDDLPRSQDRKGRMGPAAPTADPGHSGAGELLFNHASASSNTDAPPLRGASPQSCSACSAYYFRAGARTGKRQASWGRKAAHKAALARSLDRKIIRVAGSKVAITSSPGTPCAPLSSPNPWLGRQSSAQPTTGGLDASIQFQRVA